MPSNLRIAVWYNLPSGGGKRALNDHLRGLKARGHDIVAWRPPIPQEDYLPISEIVDERVLPLDVAAQTKGRIGRIRQGLAGGSPMREAMIQHSKAVAKEVEAGGFDVLFANTCRHYHAPWVGRDVKIPRLLYLQEPKRNFYEAPYLPWPALSEGASFKQKLKDAYRVHGFRRQVADEHENARSFDRILVNSNFSRESILRAYGLDAQVCYLGIDASRFVARDLPRDPLVVSVGIFDPAKRPEFIVRALGTITENRPPLIWIANRVDEAERTRVSAIAREIGVKLEIQQYIPDEELLDLLNRASVLAYAPRLEPFGYAPLEANACGCPAVVISEGGVKESVRDGVNGLVVPHRPEAMGSAIAGLLARSDEAREMGRRAATYVREAWSLERATDELERHLHQIAGKD